MRQNKKIINIFLMVSSFVFSLVALEIIARCFISISFDDFIMQWTTRIWADNWFNENNVIPSSTLGYKMRPSTDGRNSLGMYDKERASVKNPDTYRIIVVGDSVTLESKFPQAMEELCAQYNFRKKIEVWNCAVVGYSIMQKCLALQEEWLQFEPDLVIIGFSQNDFATTPVVAKMDGRLIGFFPLYSNLRLSPFWLKYSALYRFLMKRIFIYRVHKVDTDLALQNNIVSILEKTKHTIDLKKIPFIIAILPMPVEYEKNIQDQNFNRIRQIATKLHIDTLDILFDKDINPYTLRINPRDEGHLNVVAGEIVAQKIVNYLKQKSYLEGNDNNFTWGPEAKIVRKIFDKFEEFRSFRRVVIWLNDKGYLTKRGQSWPAATVKRILNSHVYKGYYTYGKRAGGSKVYLPQSEWKINKGDFEPIISEKQFDRVQALIRQRQFTKPKRYNVIYLLSGLLRCKECGGALCGHTQQKPKSGKTYSTYRCHHHLSKGNRVCSGVIVKKAKLEQDVLDEIRKVAHLHFEEAEAGELLAKEESGNSIEDLKTIEMAYFEMGNIGLRTKDDLSAEKEYKKVLTLNPHFFYAALELGKLYHYRLKNPDLAVKEFKRAIFESPEDWEAYYELGMIYKEKGETEVSFKYLKDALDKNKNRNEVHLELGKMYREMDMPDEAVKEFEKVLAIEANRNDKFISNKVMNEIEITQKKIILESKVRAMVAMILNKCNLSCIMCHIWKSPWQASAKTMDEIVSLLPYIEDMVWEGGEVLLMKGFDDIIKEASRFKNLKQVIFTNGLIFNEQIIEKIINSRVDLVFSIDGATKETYEYIRKGGKFKHLLRNPGLIKRAKEVAGGKIETHFNSIIMKSNYREAEKLIDFAKEYDFNAVTLTPIRGDFGEENIFDKNNVAALESLKLVMPRLVKKAQDCGIILNNWLPSIEESCMEGCRGDIIKQEACKNNSSLPKNKMICYAPWQRLVLDSEGQVRPFVFCLDKWIGNSDKNSLEEIWNSEAMQEYRRRIINCDYTGLCQPECISGQVADKIRDIIV